MNCPNCGLPLASPPPANCPRCGMATAARLPQAQASGGAGYEATVVDSGAVPGPIPMQGPGAAASPQAPWQNPPGRFADGSPYDTQAASPYSTTPQEPGSPRQMPQPPGYRTASPPMWAAPQSLPVQQPRKRRPWLVAVLFVVVACVVVGVGAAVLTRVANLNSGTYESSLHAVASGWVTNSNCFVSADGYHIKGSYICYAPVDAEADATFTVTAQQTGGDDTFLYYGVVLRRASQGNYYMFSVDSQGKWRFGKVIDGKYNDVVKEQSSEALNLGDVSNTLSVQAKGQQFTFFINGTKVGTASDATYQSGLWGLSGSDKIEVVYTDVKIARNA